MTTPRAVSRGLASGHVGTLAVPLALAVCTLTDRAAPLDQRLPTHLVVRASSAA